LVYADVVSGDLEARLILRSYAGFIANRYPSAIAEVTGAGLKVEANF
jgi:hypothetical protein